DEVIEGRAVPIVTVAHAEMAGPARRRHTGGGFGTQRLGSSRDDAALPLLEALVDAQSLVGTREQAMQRLHADEPDTLQKIGQQQRGRGKLRGAESVGLKKSSQHSRNRGRPSVLPCSRHRWIPIRVRPLVNRRRWGLART